MSSGVTLTSATRQNLLSLQDTASLTATTQNRLATGKKVSSALDNPVTFFTSKSLDQRSGDLSNLLDGISNGVQAIQAANQGITSIQKLVDQAKSVANQALSTQITTTGTAGTAYATPNTSAATTISLFVNGSSTSASIPANATIDQAISALNTAVGAGSFSKDTTGTKLVVNASSDVEFATSGDQTKLGFTAGSGNTTTYGSTTAAAQSADLTVSGVSARATLATQYNSLLTQIDQLAGDSSYNGTNLIAGKGTNNNLTINFNAKGNSNLTVTATDETSNGLGLKAITGTSAGTGGLAGQGNFLLNNDINSTMNNLTAASNQLRSDSSTFGSALSVVQNRQDFTKNLINVLDTGSANLTNADLNEEAANSQALSTRQSLGISALSLANTAQQGILQLLR
ncbi:flagellin [Methylobacterium sp. J-076]|uniref:flagellin N-terminal helical domain-containing protein n=1 Tax=Methylobacterium sp. J-076 TaxID=2836655 RepID=UPI001FB8FAAD|nr:flagellin [Methylobacterium sp. J-076]MCJ2012917.1 flagellar protein [Methylobacterium sp. J-076]